MQKTGKLYSKTTSPSIEGATFEVWDRYPGTLSRARDPFSLYAPDGDFVGHFPSAVQAEREASFRLLDL